MPVKYSLSMTTNYTVIGFFKRPWEAHFNCPRKHTFRRSIGIDDIVLEMHTTQLQLENMEEFILLLSLILSAL